MIINNNVLEIVHPNMAELSKTDNAQFAILRRNGLGASDSAIYLGVNKWKTVDELIAEKCATELTEEEIAVGEKEVVRKGADLEPIILGKFADWSGLEVRKPEPMYRLKEHPQLTVNFDGVTLMGETLIPVEAKFCSIYANKYWNRGKCLKHIADGKPMLCGGSSVKEHIEMSAELYGIPPYYYTQIQQQMMALESPFGYFAVVFDKGWEFGTYKIFKDQYLQDELIKGSEMVWEQVLEKRRS